MHRSRLRPRLPGAVESARRRLLDWHRRFTRFEPTSELSRLNSDPRPLVPVSPDMARFVEAAVHAARVTGGLVDPTLGREIRDAGYDRHHERSLPLDLALRLNRRRAAARPHPSARWSKVSLASGDRIARPPGVELDSGGIAKGLFADLLGEVLAGYDAYAVDCAGDVRLGGAAGLPRPVRVAGLFGGEQLHEFELLDGAAATSGISRRSWLDRDGRPAHHLLDPATGRPAFTGLVQATALAPTAIEAEARAKAAVLDGPERVDHWPQYGGLVVFDDGSHEAIEASAHLALRVAA